MPGRLIMIHASKLNANLFKWIMSSISSYQDLNSLYVLCTAVYPPLYPPLYVFSFSIFFKENNMLIVTLKHYFKAIALKYMLIYKKKYYLILSNTKLQFNN